jgi:hypothetical protein
MAFFPKNIEQVGQIAAGVAGRSGNPPAGEKVGPRRDKLEARR